MSSSDPWSCGSRRRRDERGVVHRLPEGRPWRVPREVLPVAGGVGVVVLQVARPTTDAPWAATRRARRRGARVVRRLRWDTTHLWVAAGMGGPHRGGLASVEEDGGGLDGPPRPAGSVPETQAAVVDPPGQGRRADPGPGAPRLHRHRDQPTLVW